MGSPSWNLVIIIMLVLITGYGFILQKEKAAATLISTYVALVVTTFWGQKVYDILSGNTILFNQVWFRANLNPFTVKILLFASFIVLLSLKGEYISSRLGTIGSAFLLFLYSFLNAALIVSSIMSFMDDSTRMNLISNSNMANLLYRYHDWWIILPAIVLIVAGFKKRTYAQDERERP